MTKPIQISVKRHQRACSVCKHTRREEIEEAFVAWRSPIRIAAEFGIADRASVYRHATAFGLFEKRQRKIRRAKRSWKRFE